ncbi:hypothetical protein MMC14_007391 [Varicellaria rhodocarpa]|nr:hypothetical protein [Varicellaria rhodocarpa]
MTSLKVTFFSLLLASTALAAPKHGHHHKFHSTGTGGHRKPSGTTGLYGLGNSTAVGPTGTGTAPVVYSTILVNPLPVSSGGQFLQASASDAAAATSDTCGADVVTVTSSNTVTVTVGAESDITTTTLTSTSTVLSTIEPYSNGTSTVAPFAPSGTAPSVYSSGTISQYHHKWTSVMVSPPASSSAAAGAESSTVVAASSTLAYTLSESSSSVAASSTSVDSSLESSSVAAILSTAAAISSAASDLSTSYSSVAASSSSVAVVSTSVSSIAISSSTVAAVSTPASSAAASSSTVAVASTPISSSLAASSTAAAIPASSASASTISTRATGGLSGGKRGVVYNTASLLAPIASATNSPISWAYNWDSQSAGLPSNIKFVPQLWGLTSDHTGNWKTNAAAAIKAGSDSLMAFNEPDMPSKWGGSQIDPITAASNYITYMNGFAGQVELGAPAVSNANSSSPLYGIQWLEQFFTACNKKCSISNVPFHWYGWADGTAEAQADSFKQYVGAFTQQVTALTGITKFWITEFSALPLNNPQINAQFLEIVLPWLDSQATQIERYSFFMVSNGLLVNGGSLTASGTAYTSDP